MRDKFILGLFLAFVCSASIFAFSGNGTAKDPYLIYSKEDLTSDVISGGNYRSVYIKLMDDIDFEGETCPTLFPDRGFKGVFDGNDKVIKDAFLEQGGFIKFKSGKATVKNLTLENPTHISDDAKARAALFCYSLDTQTTIENCHIVDGIVQLPLAGFIYTPTYTATAPRSYAGGFSQSNTGTIRGCSFSGILEGTYAGAITQSNGRGGLIENCYASVDLIAGHTTGGITAFNYGIVRGCYSAGTVENIGEDWAYAGGLVGYNRSNRDIDSGVIINCHSSCNVITAGKMGGGLVGSAYGGRISRSSASGSVEGNSYLGGFIGSFVTTTWSEYIGTIENCYSTGNVLGNNRIGGFIGESGSSVVRNCYSTGSVTGEEIAGGFMGTNYFYPNTGIDDAVVENCYSTGIVSAGDESGGLIGRHWLQPIKVINSFWDTQTSGVTYSSGGEGIGTEQMQTQHTFTDANWFFASDVFNGMDDFWRMCDDGVSYPRLAWEFGTNGDFLCPDGVGGEDFVYLAEHWLITESKADFTGDGIVDMFDYAIFAQHWLEGI